MKQNLLGLSAQFWSKAKKLGLEEPAQLLWYAPVRYHDYSTPRRNLSGVNPGDHIYAKLLVSRSPVKSEKGFLTLQVSDGQQTADVTVFGDARAFAALTVNSLVHLTGDIGFWQGRLQIKNPQVVRSHQQGRLVPEYLPGESGLNRETLASRIAELLEAHAEEAVAGLEDAIGEPGSMACLKLNIPFPDFGGLLRALHQPDNLDEASQAKEGLNRLAAYQSLKVGMTTGVRRGSEETAMPPEVADIDRWTPYIPYTMTGDQRRAAQEIATDLTRKVPMHRILSGDVGSGKTVSYLIPAVAAQAAGRQVVILMPNSPLASQVMGELQSYFPETPVARLVSGDKPPVLDNKPILIGTTAILHWMQKQDPQPDIDLVIIDEQQKLGIEQKRALIGPNTHLLEATATAIPRSQAMVRFGISKISRIEEMPVKKQITSHFIDHDERQTVFNDLVARVNRGEQIAVLYPLREESLEEGEVSRRAVEQVVTLWERHFPGRVGWIHGGLSSDEKMSMLDRMRSGEIPVIVTSSVIEVGITVPNLRAMLVVEAERYGASTLHQIRGRLSRLGGEGVFYMLPSVPKADLKETARERLSLLERTTNGMEIAEADLSARGFGELARLSNEQSGFKSGYVPGIKVTPEHVKAVLDIFSESNRSVRRMMAAPAPF